MSKIKFFIQQSWLLIVSSFAFGLLIAVTNAALIDRINENEANKTSDKLRILLPDAKEILKQESITIKSPQQSDVNIELYKAITGDQCQGWVFKISGKGFADVITLMVGVDKNFEKMIGFSVLSSSETPGFGDRIAGSYYRNQFVGAPVGKLNLKKTGDPDIIDSDIVAISGATISSSAVVNMINDTMLQLKSKMLEKGMIQDVQ
ncbi:MAG TPA: FMN-binding protein [Sedimentisphaerales bacterium]|nr:FMN-binding protein [Sedimentisphaerales bacterium]